MRRGEGERPALIAVGLIGAVTAAWWALALWPVGSGAPEWVVRVRSVCFGSAESGLPDASGWMLLIGQPVGMLALAWAIWREVLPGALSGLWRSSGGRGLTVVAVLGALLLGVFTGTRVRTGIEAGSVVFPEEEMPPVTYPRLDRDPPEFLLVDQSGAEIGLERYRGRTVVVTFGFGNCATICPLQVHNTVQMRSALPPDRRPALLVLTLDPWRDTAARLSDIAERWGMVGPDAHLLGGAVEDVEAALDGWQVPRSRDLTTGDIVHPALAYVVAPDGRVAYALQGDVEALAELVRRAGVSSPE